MYATNEIQVNPTPLVRIRKKYAGHRDSVVERGGSNKTIFYAACMYEEKVRMVLINLVDEPECRVYFKTLSDKRSLTIRGYFNNIPILNILEDIWRYMDTLLKQHNRYRLYAETGLWNVIKE